jgi:photosystem II stability/assembly factor-like uncharacterized protein
MKILHRLPNVPCLLLVLLVLLAPPGTAQQATPSATLLDRLEWRHIGPANFGGRVDDIEAVPGKPTTIFVGTAGGGVFRSVNNGTTWTPVFDAFGGSVSIGDIALAPSDPNIVWVGTGEPNNRQSSTWGDGIYRSLDGGTTWTHMGLRDTHHIGRSVIHPRDPSTVFVAALGHLWGPNADRGLYRTRDAGRTWQKVLTVDENTGVVDVAIDNDGRTLYAATYQRRRRGFGFVGGGPGSALWRSLDGGDSWQKLGGGLPGGVTGRIGIAIARSRPDIVYAVVENRQGGIFRSDDRGTSWHKVNALNPRPMYYSQIRVDPTNPDKVWVLGTNLHLSIDGGKTFRTDSTLDRIHVDNHALWIDPSNPDHLMLGNDGGLHFTWDGAKNWEFVDNLPIGQFYDVDVDEREPYWLFGGAQDNGSWAMPVRNASLLGLTNADVVNTAYGDGFYSVSDRKNPRYVFANSQNGRAYRVDLVTREEQGIRPVPTDSKEEYRWNWNTPQLRSPHDGAVIYYGANKLLKTSTGGSAWEEISPDLTRKLEWKKLPITGFSRDSATLSRDDGIDAYGTISTIAESPLAAGTLLVGTDDGNVQMTTDGGKNWSNLSDRFKLPAPRWVSRVLFSRHGAQTAFVAFDGHADDDMTPYLFRTTDGGRTWASIAGDLPAGNVIKSFEEHPRNRNILLAGTEFGLYATFDGGAHWSLVRSNLPRVRVDDVLFNEKTSDIVLATHGRSFIVLDDVKTLDDGDPLAMNSDVILLPTRAAVQQYQARILPQPGSRAYAAPNPPEGAILTWIVNGGAPSDTVARITITDAAGTVVRELTVAGAPGVHRAGWDLRYGRADGVTDEDEGWFGAPRGPWVLPGTYTATLQAHGKKVSRPIEVRADPRIDAPRQALESRHAAELRLQELLRSFVAATRLWDGMAKEKKRIEDAVKDRPAARDSLAPALKALGPELDSLGTRFRPGFGGPKFRYLDLDGALQAASSAPTEGQQRELSRLGTQLTEDVARLNALLAGAFAELQRKAATVGVASDLKPVTPPRE